MSISGQTWRQLVGHEENDIVNDMVLVPDVDLTGTHEREVRGDPRECNAAITCRGRLCLSANILHVVAGPGLVDYQPGMEGGGRFEDKRQPHPQAAFPRTSEFTY